jgi:hypothetical protein
MYCGLFGTLLLAICGCTAKQEEPDLTSSPKSAKAEFAERPLHGLPNLQHLDGVPPEEAFVVAGPVDTQKALELLNHCPSPEGLDHDAVALIRAVNYLQAIGKHEAVKALNEFIAATPIEASRRGEPDQQRLSLVVPILFLPKNGAEKPPRYVAGVASAFFITMQDDIPFQNVRLHAGSGSTRSTAYLVDWAKEDGKLRHKPLRPADDPLAAADRLFATATPNALRENGGLPLTHLLREHLRWQAWRMVAHLVAPREQNLPAFDSKLFGSDKWWEDAKRKVVEMRIRWDGRNQEYVSGK